MKTKPTASPFAALKPGDQVVYYQWHNDDEWPSANVDRVKSNDGTIIRLEEIWGWQFRVSDGNPVGYEENPRLSAYIVPTTPALIKRVLDQKRRINEIRDMRANLARVDWRRTDWSTVQGVYDLLPKAYSGVVTTPPKLAA